MTSTVKVDNVQKVSDDSNITNELDLKNKKIGIAGGQVDKAWLIFRAYYKKKSLANKKKDRPSPSESATQFKIGTKKKGNDGNMWKIQFKHTTKTGLVEMADAIYHLILKNSDTNVSSFVTIVVSSLLYLW